MAAVEDPTPVDQPVDDGLVLEKKKKKKKAKDVDAVDELDLGKKKKRKEKKRSKDEDGGDGDGDGYNAAPELDLSTKKKKKKDDKRKKDDKGSPQALASERKMEDLDTSLMAKYEYDALLSRVFDKMDTLGVGAGAGRQNTKFNTEPPKMARIGTKKVAFINFGMIADHFNRKEQHLKEFILAELGTTGNTDEKRQLVLKGKFQSRNIENVLRQYIKDFIMCKMCKSANTRMEKVDRLTFITCNECNSRRTVQQIKAGAVANVMKRKKLREKQDVKNRT